MSVLDDTLARVYRGPCGGWHYDGYPKGRGHRGHRSYCRACVHLGKLSTGCRTVDDDPATLDEKEDS